MNVGSKTPLAYTDYFYITTISNEFCFNYIDVNIKAPFKPIRTSKGIKTFDAIKYQYLFSKGVSLPTLDLLTQEPTTEHNGTEIRIVIKNYNDSRRFREELKSQLCYFDNVVFVDCQIDNDYRIYENDLFKFRNINQYSNEMHVVLGKVAYPIDWTLINEECVEIPVGVKFEIGELSVTPNREMLRYTDEIKELVAKRVKETVVKLKEMYLSQQATYDNFYDWYKAKNKTKCITFGEDEDVLKLTGFKDLNNQHRLKILDDLQLDGKYLIHDDVFSKLYTRDFQITNGKIVKYNSNHTNLTDKLRDYPKTYLLSNNVAWTNPKNFIHASGIILKPINVKSIVKSLIGSYRKYIIEVEITKDIKNHIKNEDNNVCDDTYFFETKYFEIGLSIKLYKLIKYLKSQIEPKIRQYHIELTDEQKKEYKEHQDKFDYAKKRKLEGKIFCKGISQSNDFDWNLEDIISPKTSYSKKSIVHGIESYKGIVIYGFAKDKRLLERALTYCYLNPKFRLKEKNYKGVVELTGKINPNACRIVQIAQNNEKYFKNKPNMIHVTKMYGDNRLFRKLASSFRIEKILSEHISKYSNWDKSFFIQQMFKINEDVGDALIEMKNFYEKFTSKEDIQYTKTMRKNLKDEILDIATKGNLFDVQIESKLKIVEDFFTGVELLRHIEITDETLPLVLKYLREKKKKINLEYYCKIVTPELIPEFDFDAVEEVQPTITLFRQLTNRVA